MKVTFSKDEVAAQVAANIEARYPAPAGQKWVASWRTYADEVDAELEDIEQPATDVVPITQADHPAE